MTSRDINATKIIFEDFKQKVLDNQFNDCDFSLIFTKDLIGISKCHQRQREVLYTLYDINNPHKAEPDAFAGIIGLLLYYDSPELFRTCNIWQDVIDKLNTLGYKDFEMPNEATDEDEKEYYQCLCQHLISNLNVFCLNGRFFLLGSTCVDKTQITELITLRKNRPYKICGVCNKPRKLGKGNDICNSCIKKDNCIQCKKLKELNDDNICNNCSKNYKLCPEVNCKLLLRFPTAVKGRTPKNIPDKCLACIETQFREENYTRELRIEKQRKEREASLKEKTLQKIKTPISLITIPVVPSGGPHQISPIDWTDPYKKEVWNVIHHLIKNTLLLEK